MIKTGEEQISRHKASPLCSFHRLASTCLKYRELIWDLRMIIFPSSAVLLGFLLLFWRKMAREISETLVSFKNSYMSYNPCFSKLHTISILSFISSSQNSCRFLSTNRKAFHCIPFSYKVNQQK